jgi:site-specific DNA-methyltransferase (adenine-specific)
MILSLEINKIINGDCVEVMKPFPENSIDCIVTDPPYGLSFMGKSWDKALPPKQAFIEMCRILKPGALAFVMSSPRQDLMWRMAQLLEESGFSLKQSFISWIYKTGFPKALDISKAIDDKLGVERKVIGESTNKIQLENLGQAGYKEKWNVTIPTSELAKKYEDYKTVSGLKPALEVIFMIQKPLSEKTIVDNVLKWGTGAINVGACRIPFEPEGIEQHNTQAKSGLGKNVFGQYKNDIIDNSELLRYNTQGRFPANVIVSDDALNDGKPQNKGHTPKISMTNTLYKGGFKPIEKEEEYFNDSGSASRYFDLDAWAEHHGLLQISKAPTNERDSGIEGEESIPKSNFNLNNGEKDERFDGAKSNPRINVHPTVKPVMLMAYLIQLGCPPDGIVLDPFVGSGTTCVAAKILGKNYIGIELDKEYFTLSLKRVGASITLSKKIEKSVYINKLADYYNTQSL